MELSSRQAARLDSDQVEVAQTGGLPSLPASQPSPAYDMASMPGFRFQPTEEELVGFYLRSMVMGNRLEVDLISVLNLYRYDPWELPAMAFMQGDREWLFFCPRDKKYPNGARPNRVTASGYWKATGTDRPVRRAHDARCIGLKKTLVFYTGKAPRGQKTEWIMNEYRLPQSEPSSSFCQTLQSFHLKPSITSTQVLDRSRPEVALCRIYKKPFQINLISITDNLFSDNSMADVTDAPGRCSPYPASPSPKCVKLADGRRSTLDTGKADVIGISTSRACRNNIVKLEGDMSSNLMRFKYPGFLAPAAGDLSAQVLTPEVDSPLHHLLLRNNRSPVPNSGVDRFRESDLSVMTAGADRSATQGHQVVDRLNWSDCIASGGSVGSGINFQVRSADLCPTIASIDRLLKASMWSPPSPLPTTLESAGALHLDCMDYGDDSEPSNVLDQFVWSYDKLGCKDTVDNTLFTPSGSCDLAGSLHEEPATSSNDDHLSHLKLGRKLV